MRILSENTCAVFIDFQEKLVPAMSKSEKIIERTAILAKGLQEIGIPMAVSQQYTKGLGETVPAIKDVIENFSYTDKTTFSCWENDDLNKWFRDQNKQTVIVCGIEAHICVLQTVVDLISAGFYVFVVADCIGSRSDFDMEIGMQRLKDEGAFLTTTEAVLFELVGGAKSPNFKAISNLIK